MSLSQVAGTVKSESIFDRQSDWDALVASVVFDAQGMTQAESPSRLSDVHARFTGALPLRTWHGWDDAVDAPWALGGTRSVPVVRDDSPELVRRSPSLPSVLHRVCRRRHEAGLPHRARLLLSGSCLPMTRCLFSAFSPSLGLAGVHLPVRTFDFGQAARFRGVRVPAVASGCAPRGQVADCLGTPLTDTARSLALLRDVGLPHGEPDAFRPSLIRLRVCEPLLTFEHAAVRPHRAEWDQRATADVWKTIRHLRRIRRYLLSLPADRGEDVTHAVLYGVR
ncbi:hypothetical protein ACFC8N_39035 [Streptomyces sp. NPDC055966]|uniref:hypothetical protein n=1 Tax=Streptomyces sp. NPDC055966 TaxID=3345669 RepID=UPI0035DA53BE